MYTKFMDMCSGGGVKLGAEYIYIQAKGDEAESVFEEILGRDPNNITCNCCGPDFCVYDEVSDGKDIESGSIVITSEDIENSRNGIPLRLVK